MGRFIIEDNVTGFTHNAMCIEVVLDIARQAYPRTSAYSSTAVSNRFIEKYKHYEGMLEDMASGNIKGSRQIYDPRYGLYLTIRYVHQPVQLSEVVYEVTRDGVSIFIGKKSLALTHLQLDMLQRVGYNKKQQIFILDQLFNDLEAEVESTTHEGTVKWLMKKID